MFNLFGSPVGSGEAPINPLDYSPYLWFKTDEGEGVDYTLSGGKVTQWTDHSGNGRNGIQSNDAARPTISDLGLLFSGAQFLNFSKVSGTYITVFFVAKSTGASNSKMVLGTDDIDNGNNHWFLNYSGGNWRVYFNGQTLSLMQDLTTIPTDSKALLVGTKSYKSMGGELYLSSKLRQFTGYLNNTGLLYLDSIGFVRDNAASIYASNDLYYELIIYDSLLDTVKRGKIAQYLIEKHSIVVPST